MRRLKSGALRFLLGNDSCLTTGLPLRDYRCGTVEELHLTSKKNGEWDCIPASEVCKVHKALENGANGCTVV